MFIMRPIFLFTFQFIKLQFNKQKLNCIKNAYAALLSTSPLFRYTFDNTTNII